MKKWICMILVLVMVFSLAACAAKKSAEESPAPAEEKASAAPASAAPASAAPASAAPASAAPSGSDDGQNPIMNFIGNYVNGRATVTVEAADAKDGVKISVTWSSSAAEHSEWVMSGKFDADKLTVDYADCVRTDIVFKEDGSVDSQKVVYENGKGTITFADGGALTLTWKDAQENVADGMVFDYAS